MASVFNFYLSRVIGNELITKNDEVIGKVKDFIVDFNYVKPMVKALQIKSEGKVRNIDFSEVEIKKFKNKFVVYCNDLKDIEIPSENTILLNKWVIDRQIVDINGRKVVRVNDLRLTTVSTGTYLLAVDVGLEGLLRRLGLALIVKSILAPLNKSIPTKLILWDDVETIDTSHAGIKLSKTYTKLHTLHPSDLADIIEDLDRNTQTAIFQSLDDEKAADVLEELEADAQKNILESISLEKAADVLEKMPADEVADILDELEQDKAEKLLNEMEDETSEEVRELMEYPENTVGSLMTTDYISLNQNITVNETINELRKLKPEADSIYYLYIVDEKETLIGIVSLRDLIISQPETPLNKIMNTEVIHVYDHDKIDSLVQIITKYNLFAIPVADKEEKLTGMVIIDDVVHNLLKSRRRV